MKNRKGSALLVALVFAGLLTLVTVGVSSLISRETRIVSGLLTQTRAYYAAESGIELALLDVQENKPGFEANTEILEISSDPMVAVKYKVASRTNRIPVLADYQLRLLGTVLDESVSYNSLKLNESIKLPFTDDISDFVVEYYYPLTGFLESTQLNQFDILRWKLFGKNKKTGEIDSLNEFVPASDQTRSKGTSPGSPVSLGPNGDWNVGTFFPSTFDENSDLVGSEMRIGEFMQNHEQNYLILTNFLDPAKLSGTFDLERKDAATVYYRVRDLANLNTVTGSGNLVSPTSKIKSIGIAGGAERTLEVSVAPDSFLPIFDFALYRPKL